MQVEELRNDRKHNKNSSTETTLLLNQRNANDVAHTPKGTTKPATPPFQPTVLSLLIGGDDVYNAHHILDQINTDPGTAQTLFTERPEYWKPACEKIALLRIAIIAETTQTASIDPYTKEQLIGALLKEKPANATAMECLETIYEGKQAKIECVMSLTGSDLVLRLFLQGRYFETTSIGNATSPLPRLPGTEHFTDRSIVELLDSQPLRDEFDVQAPYLSQQQYAAIRTTRDTFRSSFGANSEHRTSTIVRPLEE